MSLSSLLKNPKIVAILTIVIVGASFGAYYQYQSAVSNAVQSSISKTNIKINSVELLEADQSKMKIRANYTIDNPSNHQALVEGRNLTVELVLNQTASLKLGYFDMGQLGVDPGVNKFVSNYTIVFTDNKVFDELIKVLIMDEYVEITISGTFNVKVSDLMIPVEATVHAEKTASIKALNGLKDITVNSLAIEGGENNSLSFELSATVNNPSYIEFNISEIKWRVIYSSQIVGSISAQNIEMRHGDNEIIALGALYTNTSAAQELVSSYISGENVSITLNGTVSLGSKIGATKYNVSIELPVKLTGQPDIQVSILNVTFTKFEENRIIARIGVNIYNPSNITGVLKNVLLDVIYQNQTLGTIHVFDIPLKHGNNTVVGEVAFTPTNISALRDLTYKYLTGKNITITVKGSPTGNTISSLLRGWSQSITIKSPGKLSFSLKSIGLLNSTTDSLFFKVNITINNPVDAEVKLDNLTIEAEVSDTGDYLGNATINSVDLLPGTNNLTTIVKFQPGNSTLVADLVNRYLNNENITITVRISNTTNSLIGKILGGYEFNATIHGVNPVDIFIISINVLNITNSSLLTSVNISITNPTSSSIHLENITFHVEYRNETLGNITLSAIDVAPGTHVYSLNVTFTPTNTTLIKELAREYVSGVKIELQVRGYSTGNDVLSKVLQRYYTTIVVPPLNLDFNVTGFNLLNSTNTTLVIGVNVSLSNQLITSIEIWNVTLSLYYNNQYIGNCTISSATIQPGTAQYQIVGTLDASANKTNIEEFLSKYITGETLSLNITGFFITNLSGLIDNTVIPLSFTYQLPGITESLITGVSLYSLTIDMSTYTITANTRANIFNPMNFNITILSLQYDIYFDDNDGANFDFLFVHFSYPPKQNILIDSIYKDLSGSPIVLQSNSTTSITQSININDMELAARLYDEYTLKNRLKVNILNGLMTIQIGSFQVQISFEFYNVPVS